jgi:nucleoside-diphosphate-sugar epimerase
MGKTEKRIIAVLGATGHIAKSLAYLLAPTKTYELFLIARSTDRLYSFLDSVNLRNLVNTRPLEGFPDGEYDVIINCIGIGDPAKIRDAEISILRLTEHFDNMVLDYLDAHQEVMYVNFSSGAVYGTDFNSPVDESTSSIIDVNHITAQDFYRMAKLNSETKHRALKNLNIVDLRVFGYFSRFIDLRSRFFMSEVISCVQQGKGLLTNRDEMVRDYVHPRDLVCLIEQCIARQSLNDFFDVFSLKPATKFEILDYFKKEYGLRYSIGKGAHVLVATGRKNVYCSNNRRAETIGYSPRFTSMECIIEESRALLSKK